MIVFPSWNIATITHFILERPELNTKIALGRLRECRSIFRTCVASSVARFGEFWKFLESNIPEKVPKLFADSLDYLEKHPF